MAVLWIIAPGFVLAFSLVVIKSVDAIKRGNQALHIELAATQAMAEEIGSVRDVSSKTAKAVRLTNDYFDAVGDR